MMIIVLHCAEVTRVCCEKGMIRNLSFGGKWGLTLKNLYIVIFSAFCKKEKYFLCIIILQL